MEFPETVVTKSREGKVEVRALESRGSYVMCKYIDPKTMKPADRKRKLMLKDENGVISEFFIIPLKDAKRSLLLTSEPEEKDRKVWNDTKKQAEDLWVR
jgi:hypothetical protein